MLSYALVPVFRPLIGECLSLFALGVCILIIVSGIWHVWRIVGGCDWNYISVVFGSMFVYCIWDSVRLVYACGRVPGTVYVVAM